MSAKKSKHGAKKNPAPTGYTPAVPAAAAAAPATSAPAAAMAEAPTSWIDSSDPRKRTFGKILLAGVWIYVAALWLLALDQTFNWGIFGPKVPPIP